MKQKYNRFILYCLASGIIAGLAACSKMDSTYHEFIKNGPTLYAGKADSVLALGGRNRIKLIWQISDPAISKCVIFWTREGILDSALVSVDKVDGVTTINRILDDLPENSYTFYIYTYDKWGNVSVPNEIIGNTYGNIFMASLNNRQIKSLELSGDGLKTVLNWYNPVNKEIGTELKYLNKEGVEQIMVVPPDQSRTEIEGFKYNSQLLYRSLYLPDSGAIDTFSVNYSVAKLPKYTVELDKSKFSQYNLQGDVNNSIYQSYAMPRIWDNNILGTSWYCSATTGVPEFTFAFDLGVSARLGHFKIWQRFKDAIANGYNKANPKAFEIWGTNETPDADGSWTNWTKLGSFEIIKPSGLPIGQLSEVDKAALDAGHNFAFDEDTPPVRYLRIRINEVWGDLIYFYFSELSFFGSPE